ncbi:MAG: 3-hydroxyacyl-CoA dehydrogenase NAD-binding domain-containing protein [Gammaproteobacteria bacterium]|nr:3-hydroxyacyl-CoA dehydrogenase NAD-binding domain-containing protein [Gammaproteobacteria bacterium]
MKSPAKTILVIGGGKMGGSIIQLFIESSRDEIIWLARNESQAAKLRKKLKRIKKVIGFNSDDVSRVSIDTNPEVICQADYIIETVIEDVNVKKQIFELCLEYANENAILITNSSSYIPYDITDDIKILHRMAGVHFFYPVSGTSLVEVITHSDIDEDAAIELRRFCDSYKLRTIWQDRNNAFMINMFIMHMASEALRLSLTVGLIKSNYLSQSQLFPYGVLALFDAIGLPTIWHAQVSYLKRNNFIKIGTSEKIIGLISDFIDNAKTNTPRLLSGDNFNIVDPSDSSYSELVKIEMSDVDAKDYLESVLINSCLIAIESELISLSDVEYALKYVYGAKVSLSSEIRRIGSDKIISLLLKGYEKTNESYLLPSKLIINNEFLDNQLKETA